MSTQSRVLEPEAIGEWRGFHLIDARESEAIEKTGHLPGAVPVSPKAWDTAAKAPATSLDNQAHWAGEIGRLGIDGSRKVAVYDDGRLTDAARVWFFLQHFGVDAHVVDGGWPQIAPLAGTIEPGVPASPAPVRFEVSDEAAAELLDRKALAGRLGPEIQVWDARTAAEYDGSDARKNPRPGRIPGARLLNHLTLIGADGRLLRPAELRGLLDRSGFEPGKPIVAYCEGGGRAALAALAAVHAGYPRAGAYYLSFADWSPDTACPVER